MPDYEEKYFLKLSNISIRYQLGIKKLIKVLGIFLTIQINCGYFFDTKDLEHIFGNSRVKPFHYFGH